MIDYYSLLYLDIRYILKKLILNVKETAQKIQGLYTVKRSDIVEQVEQVDKKKKKKKD